MALFMRRRRHMANETVAGQQVVEPAGGDRILEMNVDVTDNEHRVGVGDETIEDVRQIASERGRNGLRTWSVDDQHNAGRRAGRDAVAQELERTGFFPQFELLGRTEFNSQFELRQSYSGYCHSGDASVVG